MSRYEQAMQILAALGIDSSRKITRLKIEFSGGDVPRVYVEEIRTDTAEFAEVLSTTYKLVPIVDDQVSRDWHEDAGQENGSYSNTCADCGEVFTGHKRRYVCRMCATQPPGAAPTIASIAGAAPGVLSPASAPLPGDCAEITGLRPGWRFAPLTDAWRPPSRTVREPSIVEPALHFAASIVKRVKAVWAKVREKVKRG